MDRMPSLSDILDCIVIGAGPGGLQAAIHLGRYNRRVLLLDRGGGSTRSAVHIENYLALEHVSGQEIIARGLEQIRKFGVRHLKKKVDLLLHRKDHFEAVAGEDRYLASFVVVSTGVGLDFPRIRNLHRFFGRGFFTCIDCDGFNTTGKKVVVAGNSAETLRLAYAMKQMFTSKISILLTGYQLPKEDRALAEEDGFDIVEGIAEELLGREELTGIRLTDGRIISCEAIMAGYGFHYNDQFLAGLPLARDSRGNILVNVHGETSVQRLYAVGSLRPGNSQAIIAAGQGATAAIDINKQLLAI
jgi:thioredoxin reductase (NADPH)